MKCLIFLSIISLGHCRPQSANQNLGVEIEKQTIIELPNQNEYARSVSNHEENQYKENTINILQKIAEINMNHTFAARQKTENNSTQNSNYQLVKENKSKQLPNFQLPSIPFSNPIFDYLQKENTEKLLTRHSTSNTNGEEVPEGNKIIRKVTHVQTYYIPTYQQLPNPYYDSMFAPQPNPASLSGQGHYGLIPLNSEPQSQSINVPENTKVVNTDVNQNKNNPLDAMTQVKQNYLINNIKNIVSNSQAEKYQQNMYPNIHNPYMGYQQFPLPMMPYGPYLDQYQNFPQYAPNPYPNGYPFQQQYPEVSPYFPIADQKISDTFLANLQTNRSNPSQNPSGRQFNGPFAQYFPLVIKNPFQQIFQAFTNMIEYGPEADICRRNHENDRSNPKIEASQRSSEPSLNSKSSKIENAFNKLKDDLKFANDIEVEMKSKTPSFQLKDEDTNTEIIIDEIEEINNPSSEEFVDKLENRKLGDAEKTPIDKKFLTSLKISPRQEPGNSIVIHKLRVRKGGVAIAGPGGIATAGNGGTAIVGPNGFAYTQPNGLAIAGPGSKVIAVDPEVNLSDVVANLLKNNSSTPRVGKIVAVGPVVYHNLGKISYIPFYGSARGNTLKIIEAPDGTVTTQIIKTDEVKQPQLKQEISSIQRNAQTITQLQETAKKNGELNNEEQTKYNQNLDQLNISVKNLAEFQTAQVDDIESEFDGATKTNLQSWFNLKKEKFFAKQSEENKEEEAGNGNEEENTDDDGVSIDLPPDNAAVAEAKPVGLAIAGPGGVAASKPIATAIAGVGGLAIARPIATAIAGVSPDDAVVPVISDGYISFPQKKKEKPVKKEDKNKETKKEEKSLEDYLVGYEQNFER